MRTKIGNVMVVTGDEMSQIRTASNYMLIGYDLYIRNDVYLRDIFDAAGYKTFDTALPQTWVNEEMAQGKPFPKGVWSYDKNRIFGDFVPMETALERIVELWKELAK